MKKEYFCEMRRNEARDFIEMCAELGDTVAYNGKFCAMIETAFGDVYFITKKD